MKTLHKDDWANLLKILAAVLAAILGTLGAESFDAEKLGII